MNPKKPPSILLVTDSMDRGGAQTHILTLARALTAHGCAITVASSGGALTESLLASKIEHVTLPPCRPLSLFKMRKILKKHCQEARPDCIHAHARLPALAVAPIAKRLKIPTVTTVHARFRTDPLRRRLSRWGDHTIAVSEDLRQYLCEEYGISADRITLIPNGIEPASLPDVRSGKPRLVFCSRLDGDCSRVAFLLCEIAERLRAEFPFLQILFIGGGNALPALQEQIASIHRRAHTPFLFCTGAVERPTEHMRPSDLFVGVSRAALEAMALGLPTVLAGNEGFCGVLFKGNLARAARSNFCCRAEIQADAEALYAACASLLSLSEQERRRLGDTLSAYVRRHHSIDAVAEQTLRVYERILPKPQAATPKSLVLCGYYGYGNTGDECLMHAAIERAQRKHPDHTVSLLLSRRARRTPPLGVSVLWRSRPLSIMLALRRADRFVLGGGTLLQDRSSLRSLLYYAALLAVAHRGGARCELWANGLSTPRTRLGKPIMRRALARCAYVGLRDERSIALARKLTEEQKKIVREDDLALGLCASEHARIDFLMRHYRLDGRFAVVAPNGNAAPPLVKRLQQELRSLEQDGTSILLVPLFAKEDARLCRALLTRERRLALGLSAGDLIGLMAKSKCVLGMRLHALILAKNANAHFIGLGKDEKLQAFCAEQGAPCLYE